MKGFLLFSLLLTLASAGAQLQEYRATDNPRAAENIAQPCGYQATFPAGDRPVKAAWVTYDWGPTSHTSIPTLTFLLLPSGTI